MIDAEYDEEDTNTNGNLDVFDAEQPVSQDITRPKDSINLKSYAQMSKEYWFQFIDPKMWRSMPICLIIGFAFWSLKWIPNYSKCMLSPSIFSIISGVLLTLIPPVKTFFGSDFMKTGVGFSKGMFMRLAVICYGFKTKLTDIGDVGWGGAIAAFLMVTLTLSMGCAIGHLFKIPPSSYQVVSTGFSICGIAAIMSSAGIFCSSSTEISLACLFVIIGGFIDIVVYPSLYAAKAKLFGSDRNFGIAAGISIKEIAHTVSVGLSCSETVSRFAMIVKMFKVLLLPFLLIALAIIIPMTQKRELITVDMTRSEKLLDFFNKVSIPYFAFIFIIVTIINSFIDISGTVLQAFDEIIVIALSTSMFCVGITTDLSQIRKTSGWRPIVHALILYVWVFFFGWFLEYCFKNV